MAPGKARGIKRPSATNSYSSATTIVIFVGLSILGLWLLTSNSFTPPRATTTTTIIPTTTTPARITSIGHHHSQNHHSNHDPIHVEHSTEDKEHEAAIIPEELETKTEIDEAQTDNGGVKVEATGKQDSTGSDRQDSIEEPEKQEIQTSEESSMTQKQVAGQIKEEKPVSETNVVANEADHGSETTENQITDEDQQQRIDEHQKQGDEQNQQEQDQQQQIDEHQKQGDGQNQQEQDQQQQIDEHQKQEDEQNQQEQDQQQQMDEHQKRGDVQNQREQEAQSKDPNGATSHAQIQHDEVMHVDSHQDVTNQEIKQEQEPLVENGDSSSIPEESTESKKSWTTQAHQSEGQKERRKTGLNDKEGSNHGHTWLLCNVTAGADYMPCLDNEKVIANIHSRSHHEHRERHCPEDPPTCLVPLPQGYKKRIDWPQSRDKIWYNNVPHTSLAEYKGHQNWVKVTGEFLTFPGGGTQFIHGALHYIEFLQEAVPDISWGKHTRVVLDVGCGVASFGGYLFEKDVITISLAPKDEHEAQVQFALERGIPAISAVMGSQRLPFPSRVFDVVHCARCRVPWHADGGALLLELNRVLRPGGYFVWSATPVYQKLEEDVQIWKEMSSLTVAMCWELVTIKKDKMNSIGAAIYQKPDSNDCYDRRKKNEPPMCKTDDDPNAAWYILLQSCMHRIPTQENERGSQWPEEWPERLMSTPYWLNKSQMGIYGKPAPDDFLSDYEHWKKVVNTMYMNDMGINWFEVRNAMDLRAVYGGFAAALRDQNLWVMNVVNIDSPDTLPIIYERGLFGIYHDWCESFSTYPRSYDLLHADHLFSKLKERCTLEVAMAEIDRILRPGGKMIVRDEASVVAEVLDLLKSLHWEVFLNHSKNQEGILSAQKSDWRPTSFADSS